MTEDAKLQCREFLDRLAVAIHQHLPATHEKIPIERLPVLADLVRTHIETEAVFAQAAEQATAGATVEPSGE